MLPALPSNPNTTHQVHLDSNNSSSNNSSQRDSSTAPKRNTSMIFRIEHLLPLPPPAAMTITTSNSSTAPTLTPNTISTSSSLRSISSVLQSTTNGGRRSKTFRNSGVYLKQFAPKDTVSEAIATLELISAAPEQHQHQQQQQSQQRHQHQQTTRAYCPIQQEILRPTAAIMRKIKLSEDIHSYNALFEVCNGDVRLRIVRDIGRDEELIAWFDEEITLLMSIPFLTPMNIQGNNRYTCHLCNLTFETPNPLKIHLALSCGRHTLDILWIRLHYALRSSTLNQQLLPLPLLHHHHHHHHHHHPHLTSTQLPHRSPGHLTCSSSSSSVTTNSPVDSSTTSSMQRFSAFKPISASLTPITSVTSASHSSTIASLTTTSIAGITPALTLPLTTQSNNSLSFLPSVSSASALNPMTLLQPPGASPLNAAAQIEAIVSNMGASKQGHLCIYCGKVYSRKYGLKIHIRTHTGFKPLKCKFCLRPFGDPSNLNKHVRLHLQSNSSSSSTPNESLEGYKCHLCHKTLARRRDLQRHIETRHNSGS